MLRTGGRDERPAGTTSSFSTRGSRTGPAWALSRVLPRSFHQTPEGRGPRPASAPACMAHPPPATAHTRGHTPPSPASRAHPAAPSARPKRAPSAHPASRGPIARGGPPGVQIAGDAGLGGLEAAGRARAGTGLREGHLPAAWLSESKPTRSGAWPGIAAPSRGEPG